MSEQAESLVRHLLEEEGGTESFDYAPEDLAQYERFKEEQRQLEREDRILDPATGNYSREWMANWVAFEKLRNRYNGMPPKQLVLGSSNERRS